MGLACLLLLAACHSSDDANIKGAEPIECHIPGQSGFKKVCTIERMETSDGMVFTARAPDGGFHRFMAVHDNRHFIAADGAEVLKVRNRPDGIEVTAGNITYHMPADGMLADAGTPGEHH